MSVRVRFAPSPTGYLHVGNIRAALLNWLFARQHKGIFILRLDDTDSGRSTAAFADAIIEDLSWLGLAPDETYSQSARLDRYDAAVEKLKVDGRLYACYETPDQLKLKSKMQLARHKPPVYDREGLRLSADDREQLEAKGRKPHWRFKLNSPGRVVFNDHIRGEVSISLDSVSDPVLIREDGSYLYSLPSVVDDIDMKISHVVRGEDHVTNSAVQVEIFEALGANAPDFAHFSLFTAHDGGSLSKRYGALAIRNLRSDGVEPMALLSLLAHLGTSEAVVPEVDMAPLINNFAFSKFSRSAVKFDERELMGLNAKIMHRLEYDDIVDHVGIEGFDEAFWLAVRPNIGRLSDVHEWWRIVHGSLDPLPGDQAYLDAALEQFPGGALTNDSWKAWTEAVKGATNRKGKDLFLPLRRALTGQDHGPEMNVLLPLIGAERAKARLKGAKA
jgi:glutamyl-tRNA synthetase